MALLIGYYVWRQSIQFFLSGHIFSYGGFNLLERVIILHKMMKFDHDVFQFFISFHFRLIGPYQTIQTYEVQRRYKYK